MATGSTGSVPLFRIQYQALSQRQYRARIRNERMLHDARRLRDSLSSVNCNKLQTLKQEYTQLMSTMAYFQAERSNVSNDLRSLAIRASYLPHRQQSTMNIKPTLDSSQNGSSNSFSRLHQEDVGVVESVTSHLAGLTVPPPLQHAVLPTTVVMDDPVPSTVTGKKESNTPSMSLGLNQSPVVEVEGSASTFTREGYGKNEENALLQIEVTRSSKLSHEKTALLNIQEGRKVEDDHLDSAANVSPSPSHNLFSTTDTSVIVSHPHANPKGNDLHTSNLHIATANHPHTSATSGHAHTSPTGTPHTSATAKYPCTIYSSSSSVIASFPHSSNTASHPCTSAGASHSLIVATTSQPHSTATSDHPGSTGNPCIFTQAASDTHPHTCNTCGSPPSSDEICHIAVTSNPSCASITNNSDHLEHIAVANHVETNLYVEKEHGLTSGGTQEQILLHKPLAMAVALEVVEENEDDSFWESRSESLSKDGQIAQENCSGSKTVPTDQTESESKHGSVFKDQIQQQSSPTGTHMVATDYSKAISRLLAVLNQQVRVDRELASRIYTISSSTDNMGQLINHSEVVASIVSQATVGDDLITWEPATLGIVMLKILTELSSSTPLIAANNQDFRTSLSQIWQQIWPLLVEHVRLLYQCGRPLRQVVNILVPALGRECSTAHQQLLKVLEEECGILDMENSSPPSPSTSSCTMSMELHSGDGIKQAYQSLSLSFMHSAPCSTSSDEGPGLGSEGDGSLPTEGHGDISLDEEVLPSSSEPGHQNHLQAGGHAARAGRAIWNESNSELELPDNGLFIDDTKDSSDFEF